MSDGLHSLTARVFFMANNMRSQNNYLKKLLDPRWQKKRLEILNRDEWQCQNCLNDKETLHVHHRIYLSGSEPWEYDNKHLVTLCSICHKEETILSKQNPDLLFDYLMRNGFLPSDLNQVLELPPDFDLIHLSQVVASAWLYTLTNKEAQKLMVDNYFLSLKNKSTDSDIFIKE